MKSFLGSVLMVIGLLTLLGESLRTSAGTDLSESATGFGIGVITLCLGFFLFRRKSPLAKRDGDEVWIEVLDEPHPWAEALAGRRLRVSSSALIVLGFLAMFVGYSCMRNPELPKIAGLLGWFSGWTFYIWGCVNLARWKGRPSWVGALGYLFLPGFLLLVVLPNRRRRLLAQSYEDSKMDLLVIAQRDRTFGFGYLLLAPSVVVMGALIAVSLYRNSSGSGLGEWKEVRSDSGGFVAMMPGEPRFESKRETIQTGTAEMVSYCVTSADRRELYMIIATRLSQGVQNDPRLTFKLFNVGKQDVLDGSPGATITGEKYQRRGTLNSLDLTLQPTSGGVIQARVYTTKTHYYKVIVQAPPDRIDSADVTQFFDSFHLLGNGSNVGKPVQGKSTAWW